MKTRATQPANVNINSNTNQVNVKVDLAKKVKRNVRRKGKAKISKVIVGAVITILLSLGGYYLKSKFFDRKVIDTTINPTPGIIEGKKQTK